MGTLLVHYSKLQISLHGYKYILHLEISEATLFFSVLTTSVQWNMFKITSV